MVDKVSARSSLKLRREEEKEARRQEILDAAEFVITKKGWEATNFGEIAKRARLSRSLVYFYFPNRDDLFHAVCARGLTEMGKLFEATAAKHKVGIDKLLAIGRAYYQFSLDRPLYFKVLSDYQDRDADLESQSGDEVEANNLGRDCLARVAEAIATGLNDGSIRKSVGDVVPAAVSIWAFTHGLIQIASRKEAMLTKDFNLTASQTMDHGFALLRSSLATVP